MRRASPSLLLCLFLAGSRLQGQETSAQAVQRVAAAIGPRDARQALAGISARAEASGPRGAFVSEMISLADGTAEPIAYGFSWVELYAQAEGTWKNIGNASSARP